MTQLLARSLCFWLVVVHPSFIASDDSRKEATTCFKVLQKFFTGVNYINVLLLSQACIIILDFHPSMNFSQFHTITDQKMDYRTLFFFHACT
jgi:hypothetical protein